MSAKEFNISKPKYRLAKMGYSVRNLDWLRVGALCAHELGEKIPATKDEAVSVCKAFCDQIKVDRTLLSDGRRTKKEQRRAASDAQTKNVLNGAEQMETRFVPPKRIKPLRSSSAFRGLVAYLATKEGKEAWRIARYEAIKRSHGCCECCGRSHAQHGIILHVDHIKPKSIHPELAFDPENLQVLCEDCNLGKSNRDEIRWGG